MKTLKHALICGEIKASITIANGRKKVRNLFMTKRGDGYIPDAVRILIAVVLGALLLAALVLIFKKTVIPKTQNNIDNMFNTASNTTLNS